MEDAAASFSRLVNLGEPTPAVEEAVCGEEDREEPDVVEDLVGDGHLPVEGAVAVISRHHSAKAV